MAQYKLAKEDLLLIPPSHARNYAIINGWLRVDGISDIDVYRHPSNDKEIIIPRNTDTLDYANRMAEVIHAFADSQNRKLFEIINDLKVASPSDILRIRMDSRNTKAGIISIENCIRLYNNVKKAILAVACTIEDPEIYYARTNLAEPQRFIKSCLVGQSEIGSYVVPIICPLFDIRSKPQTGINYYTDDINLDELYTRKITTRMMKSIDQITRNIDAGDIDRLKNPRLEDGDVPIRYNLYQAIMDMEPTDKDTDVHISATWGLNEPTDAPKTVVLRRSHFSTIRDHADALAPYEEDTMKDYIGTIFSLTRDSKGDTEMEGAMGFNFLLDGEPAKAKIDVRGSNFELACDSLKSGKILKVRGILKKNIGTYHLTAIESIQVL